MSHPPHLWRCGQFLPLPTLAPLHFQVVWQLPWEGVLAVELAWHQQQPGLPPDGILLHRKRRGGRENGLLHDVRCRCVNRYGGARGEMRDSEGSCEVDWVVAWRPAQVEGTVWLMRPLCTPPPLPCYTKAAAEIKDRRPLPLPKVWKHCV